MLNKKSQYLARMVNYYAVLDAFPQMTHRELLDAHTNILGKIHVGYGRHQVDEDLVSDFPTVMDSDVSQGIDLEMSFLQ